MRQALEKYRIFPYIAWTLVIGFALFVFYLTLLLRNTQNAFGTYNQNLYQAIDRVQATDTTDGIGI